MKGRVVFQIHLKPGREQDFLKAYEAIRHLVAAGVKGHIVDQVCQSTDDPQNWLITSEWESSEPFLAWVDSPAHRETVAPMSACLGSSSSLRYVIVRETPDPLAGRPGPSGGAASRRGSRLRPGRPTSPAGWPAERWPAPTTR